MNEIKDIDVFLNQLRYNAGAIWLENDVIKLSAPKKFQNPETDDFIVNNKSKIVSILKVNHIASAKTFLSELILKRNNNLCHPLSYAQERLWFVEQFEQGTNAYHMPEVLELDIDTDKEGIKYALQQI